MHALVFIPGIMGSEMYSATGEKLWPPTGFEIKVTGYKRMAQLARDDVRVGPVIEKAVGCFDVYAPILTLFDRLGFRENDPNRRLVLYPYDWRQYLHQTARDFASLLGRVSDDGATKITVVAHSMGGLISRLAIEDPSRAGMAWLGKIDQLITLGTPHKGAPLALARILGLDSTLGVSATDFQAFANDRRYPSGYQLLPAPGEDTLWDQTNGALNVLDIYDPTVAARFGLDTTMLAKAQSVHLALTVGSRPSHIHYFQLAGIGHQTVMRLDATDSGLSKTTIEGGDGTVPIWSALGEADQRQVVPNEHSSVFIGSRFGNALGRLFGIDLGLVRALPAVSVSVPTPVIPAGQPFRVVLGLSRPVSVFSGTVVLQKLGDNGEPVAGDQGTIIAEVDYDAGPVDHLTIPVSGIDEPDFYQMVFNGVPIETEHPAKLAIARPRIE